MIAVPEQVLAVRMDELQDFARYLNFIGTGGSGCNVQFFSQPNGDIVAVITPENGDDPITYIISGGKGAALLRDLLENPEEYIPFPGLIPEPLIPQEPLLPPPLLKKNPLFSPPPKQKRIVKPILV